MCFLPGLLLNQTNGPRTRKTRPSDRERLVSQELGQRHQPKTADADGNCTCSGLVTTCTEKARARRQNGDREGQIRSKRTCEDRDTDTKETNNNERGGERQIDRAREQEERTTIPDKDRHAERNQQRGRKQKRAEIPLPKCGPFSGQNGRMTLMFGAFYVT